MTAKPPDDRPLSRGQGLTPVSYRNARRRFSAPFAGDRSGRISYMWRALKLGSPAKRRVLAMTKAERKSDMTSRLDTSRSSRHWR